MVGALGGRGKKNKNKKKMHFSGLIVDDKNENLERSEFKSQQRLNSRGVRCV